MGRKEDEIFKKLKKQKPLVKRADISPLSSRDFGKTRAKAGRNASRSAAVSRQGLTVFGEEGTAPVRKPASQKPAGRPSLDATRKQKSSGKGRQEVADSIQVKVKRSAAREASRSRADRELILGGTQERVKPTRKRTAAQLEEPLQPSKQGAAMHQAVVLSPEAGGAQPKLSFRHELKYYINYRDYTLLRGVLKALIALDPNAGPNGDYHIRSLYFDDAYETALVEKMAGYDTRNKYRIRIYNFSDEVIKFEKKMKRGQYIAKTSIRISREECDALIAGNCDCLMEREEPLAKEIYMLMKNSMLRPRVIVDYYREAYVSPFENVRITFDKDIRASLMLTDFFDPKAPVISVLEPGTMVMEVKFNRYLPPFIQSALNNVNAAQRSAVSKYVLCRKFE